MGVQVGAGSKFPPLLTSKGYKMWTNLLHKLTPVVENKRYVNLLCVGSIMLLDVFACSVLQYVICLYTNQYKRMLSTKVVSTLMTRCTCHHNSGIDVLNVCYMHIWDLTGWIVCMWLNVDTKHLF
jgi:hypothetical protein